jgi:host factor-I protein
MPSQNLQDAFLNSARKERLPATIYLTSGVKLSGRVRGFDKYCVVFETNHQEQLIFKHAISTVVTPRGGHGGHSGGRPEHGEERHDDQPGAPRRGHEPPGAPGDADA